jgi:hypothetical protein
MIGNRTANTIVCSRGSFGLNLGPLHPDLWLNLALPTITYSLLLAGTGTRKGIKMAEETVHLPESGGLTVDALAKHVKRNRRNGLMEEFMSIEEEPANATYIEAEYVLYFLYCPVSSPGAGGLLSITTT